MTEKQREAIIAGTVVGVTTGLATGLASGGIWSLPLAIKGGIIGAAGGTIGGLIFGYFSHKAALEAAEEAVTKAKDDLAKKELELANCILLQSENGIKPTGHGVSIGNSPTHTVKISTDDPIRRIHLYITPAEVSNSSNSITAVTEKDGGFSAEISHTFKACDPKGTYYVEISIEFYGSEDKILYKKYQIYVDD